MYVGNSLPGGPQTRRSTPSPAASRLDGRCCQRAGVESGWRALGALDGRWVGVGEWVVGSGPADEAKAISRGWH